MELPQIVFRRVLRFLVEYAALEPQPFQPGDTIGDVTGMDNDVIKNSMRIALGGNQYGFGDILTEDLPVSGLKAGTTLQGVTDLIVKKSGLTTETYRARISERVRLGLRKTLAKHAYPPVDEILVLPSHALTLYADLKSAQVRERLRQELTHEFQKYLMIRIHDTDFQGKVADLQARLTGRMS